MLADLGLSNSLKFSAVGIDACRAGWVAAFRLDGKPILVVLKTLSELTPHLSRETTIMIDMPIVSKGVKPISIERTPNINPKGTTGIINGLTSIMPLKKIFKLLFIFYEAFIRSRLYDQYELVF